LNFRFGLWIQPIDATANSGRTAKSLKAVVRPRYRLKKVLAQGAHAVKLADGDAIDTLRTWHHSPPAQNEGGHRRDP
jgi:hypothetical protein